MPDPRLPLTIKPLPGGYAIQFANGSRPIMIYGREPHVASAASSLTMDQARDLARRLFRTWSGETRVARPVQRHIRPLP